MDYCGIDRIGVATPKIPESASRGARKSESGGVPTKATTHSTSHILNCTCYYLQVTHSPASLLTRSSIQVRLEAERTVGSSWRVTCITHQIVISFDILILILILILEPHVFHILTLFF